MIRNILSLIFFQIITVFFLLFIFEFGLRFYFKDNESFNCYQKVKDQRKYFNGKNCYYIERYFEKNKPTLYITNQVGARITNKINNNGTRKIYFVGDSFTFGYLSNYEETYPYNSIKYYNKKGNKEKSVEVNLGVNGYQFKQNFYMINKLSKNLKDNNSLIIYGLTPNDIFDIESFDNENKFIKQSLMDQVKINIDSIKFLSIKFITSLLLKNDKIYNFLYDKKGDAAGYINKNGSKSWENKYLLLKKNLDSLDINIKNRLLITIIPQQIQIRLLKQGKKDDALSFDRKIIEICKNVGIKCVSFTEKLSKRQNYKTHFVKDGHLYPLSNIEYGKFLGEYLVFEGF